MRLVDVENSLSVLADGFEDVFDGLFFEICEVMDVLGVLLDGGEHLVFGVAFQLPLAVVAYVFAMEVFFGSLCHWDYPLLPTMQGGQRLGAGWVDEVERSWGEFDRGVSGARVLRMRRVLVLSWVVFGSVMSWAQGVRRPAITGIAFARFYTTDAAGAERFYGKTLDFDEREVDGLMVYPVNRSQWIEVSRDAPVRENRRMAAVGFTTRDAAGLERYLAGHGVKAEAPLKAGEFGVRDPEGNLVVFVQAGSEKVVSDARWLHVRRADG